MCNVAQHADAEEGHAHDKLKEPQEQPGMDQAAAEVTLASSEPEDDEPVSRPEVQSPAINLFWTHHSTEPWHRFCLFFRCIS